MTRVGGVWGGGQTSAIIVRRPTGFPEEEVSAGLYVRIKDQGGVQQGGLLRAGVLEGLPGTCACVCRPGGPPPPPRPLIPPSRRSGIRFFTGLSRGGGAAEWKRRKVGSR